MWPSSYLVIRAERNMAMCLECRTLFLDHVWLCKQTCWSEVGIIVREGVGFQGACFPKEGHRVWQQASNCHQLSPRPYDKASAKTYVAALESYSARVIGLESSCLMLSNALYWNDPQSHVLDLLKSAQSGWVSSRFGVNLPSWLTMHMNLLSSSTDVGRASTGLLLSSLCQLESCFGQWCGTGTSVWLVNHAFVWVQGCTRFLKVVECCQ